MLSPGFDSAVIDDKPEEYNSKIRYYDKETICKMFSTSQPDSNAP